MKTLNNIKGIYSNGSNKFGSLHFEAEEVKDIFKEIIEEINYNLQMVLDNYVLYGKKQMPVTETEKRLRDILEKIKKHGNFK